LNCDDYFINLAQSRGTSKDDYFKVLNQPIPAHAGKQITPDQFFGPYFNFKEQRPILLGRTPKPYGGNTVFTDNYYYNDTESLENIVLVKKDDNLDFITQGYTDAFLNPPYSFGNNGMTNYDIGKYFLEFNDFLFTEINKIIVYSWDINFSNYFDDGKEWWGSFLWTVYNPGKDWYIGIAVSATD
jgi:hypothetical protein